jgi:hypothetical protein
MEKYNICWDEFKVSAGNTFKNLLNDTDFTDVTLACEDGKQIKSHKVILSACSPFFKDILVQNPHAHPLLYLKGISHSQLKNLLNFAYLGETEVGQENLPDFMNVAKELKIEGLASYESDQVTKDEEAKSESDVLNEENITIDDQLDLEAGETENEETFDESLFPQVKIESTISFASNVTYPCDNENCDYIAKYSNHLKRHQLSKHEGIRYPCKQCETKFTQSSSLKRHMTKIHSKS